MPNTARMKWPIPGEHVDPWFEAFLDLMGEVDASGYAAREDRNIIGTGGGTFTLNSGLITWPATISFLAANTGFLWQIAPGNVTLADGQIWYVNLVRAPSDNVTLANIVASNLSAAPDGDAAFVIAVRRGSKVYFRNGNNMGDGDSFAVFESTGAGGGGGVAGLRRLVAMALDANIDQSTFEVVGDFAVNPGDYSMTGTTREIRFLAVGLITNLATTGEIQLYNLTDAAVVALLSFNGAGDTSPTKKVSGLLTLPASEKMYEVRIRVTGGTPPADKVFAMWAGLQIDNT